MFDLRDTKAAEAKTYEPIPAGDYILTCTDAVVKDTKAKNGQYVMCTLEVLGGEYAGRKIFQMFNVVNQNPEAVRIAKEQMKSMLLASGLPEEKCVIKDVSEFVGLSFMAYVKIDKDQNRVATFKQLTPESRQDVMKEAKKTNPFAGW
jgi:hypothetical protein